MRAVALAIILHAMTGTVRPSRAEKWLFRWLNIAFLACLVMGW